MEQLVLKVLNCLFGGYPNFMELETCRQRSALTEGDFLRVIAYLEEKAFVELEQVSRGVDGTFGRGRITAAGIDYVNGRSRRVTASVLRG